MGTPDERELAMSNPNPSFSTLGNAAMGDEGECAVCFADFAETPTLPVVRLPDCGHCFHGACVQELADKRGLCPICRSTVNWKAAFRPDVAPAADKEAA